MKIFFKAETDEKITNFRVAEAVINLCKEDFDLDSDAVAKMILLQNEANAKAVLNGIYARDCVERREE